MDGLEEMQCSVVVRWKDDTRHDNIDRTESGRSMDELEETQCSVVVRWMVDTGGMTTETALRVIAALMDWKRCSAVSSCDGRMIQVA